jgi:hypothetical protein
MGGQLSQCVIKSLTQSKARAVPGADARQVAIFEDITF